MRVALQHGASLVPIYSFGENNLFEQLPNPKGSKLRQFQDSLQKTMGFSAPIFQGNRHEHHHLRAIQSHTLHSTFNLQHFCLSNPLFDFCTGRGVFNYSFGVLPHRRPITTVVGKPLDLPKIEQPTKQDIDEWHEKYISALVNLYDSHKDIYDKDRKSDIRILG